MASGTISTRPQEEGVLTQGRYDDFIVKRLEHTRRQVRLVDVGSGLVLLVAASLFFFLVVAVADHWLFPHGLGFAARLLLWAVWVAVAAWFAWRSVAPSIVHRINPVFAAQAIEHGRPTLKNSLINFLLLRSHPDDVAPLVYRAMEHRAAADLLRVPVEQAVDHRRLVHLCYVLAGAVVLFALYLAFSPKNPLVSAARVIWPWSTLPAPMRVHIEDVQPGNAVAFQGDRQEISAHVSGLRNGEEVSLLLSTADGQLTDDRVPMARTGDDDRYACELPPGTGGMQQDTLYRITAGDATTPRFKLEVQIAPTILVDQVDYDYPPYTELPHRTIKGQGDIKALEGTKVTINATANLQIRDATIDLGCAGLRTLPMKHIGKQATGDFTLALDPAQNWKPLYDRYQILFTDSEGHKARHEIQYHIDIDRDYPPEIKIDQPKDETAAVGVNGQLRIHVRASDDFGLRRVALRAECSGRPLDLGVLLDRMAPEKAFTKPYDDHYDFRPAVLGLHKGDEVTYWAEADDNKEPQPNHVETARRSIRIVDDQDASQGQQNQEQQSNAQGKPSDKPEGGKGKSRPGEHGNGGESGDGTSQGEPSSGGNDRHESKENKPQNPPKGGAKKGQGEKDRTSSDPNNGDKGGSDSSENSEQEKRPLDQNTQKADVIKDSLKDLERQKQQEQNKQGKAGDNSPSGQPQEQQPKDGGTQNNQPQDGGTQTGQPQNNSSTQNNKGAQSNPPQGSNESKEQNAGQASPKSADASAGRNQAGNNAGSSKPQGTQGDSATNNTPGQQQNSPAKDPGTQGTQKTSPQPGTNSQQPNGGSPQGGQNQKPGEQSNTGQTSPQNAGSQDKGREKAASGPDKSGTNSGQENKPNAKPGGKQGKESQASSGPQSATEKMPDGQQGGSQSGGTKTNIEKKPSGARCGQQ